MKRYDIDICSSETFQGLIEDEQGDLCYWDDVKPLLAALNIISSAPVGDDGLSAVDLKRIAQEVLSGEE